MPKWQPWTRRAALIFLRKLESELVGYHCGMLGSVLHKGSSTKDLDIVIYPRNSLVNYDVGKVYKALNSLGLERLANRYRVAEEWRKNGKADEKWVEVWMYNDRRVDIFFLK